MISNAALQASVENSTHLLAGRATSPEENVASKTSKEK